MLHNISDPRRDPEQRDRFAAEREQLRERAEARIAAMTPAELSYAVIDLLQAAGTDEIDRLDELLAAVRDNAAALPARVFAAWRGIHAVMVPLVADVIEQGDAR